MKIIRLQGENFKRMSAFDITPEGNTVVISGKNAQGKTSVLDSISILFEGKKGTTAKATPKPIKEGATMAYVIAETEDFIVKKKWTSNDHEYLEITSKDGKSTFSSPQAMLDRIVGDLSFDPLAFTRLKPKDQREQLLGIVNIGLDLTKWQEQYDGIMERRKNIGREADALKGKLATLRAYPADTPEQEVSVIELAKTLQEKQARNHKIETLDGEKAMWERRVAELRQMLEGAEASLKLVTEQRAHLGESDDIAQLQKQIAFAEETNKNVRLKQERLAAERECTEKDEAYARCTADLEGLRAAKEQALRAASFPVPGLGIAEEGVTFKDVPLSQCSSAEQLKISLAIAMAKNPELRVIRITDGSLLDEENMKVLEEMAKRNDYQIWTEVVTNGDSVGIVIEDGMVSKNNYVAA